LAAWWTRRPVNLAAESRLIAVGFSLAGIGLGAHRPMDIEDRFL